MFRGRWTELDKVQAKIISIDPANRGLFNFYRRAVIRKCETQRKIKTRFNRMFTLNTHPGLRQIGHDPFPNILPTEIMEMQPGRNAAIRTEHKLSALSLLSRDLHTPTIQRHRLEKTAYEQGEGAAYKE